MASGSDQNLLNVEIQEDLVYRPKTKETRLVYEAFLSLVQRHMGDVSLEILRGAADEVFSILKMDSINDATKRVEIEVILDKMTDETFNQMMVMSQQLVDYDPEDEYRGAQREVEMEVNFEPEEEDEEEEAEGIIEVKGVDEEEAEGEMGKPDVHEEE